MVGAVREALSGDEATGLASAFRFFGVVSVFLAFGVVTSASSSSGTTGALDLRTLGETGDEREARREGVDMMEGIGTGLPSNSCLGRPLLVS